VVRASSENVKVQVRRAETTDAPVVAAVLHEAFAEFRPLYTAEGFSATAVSPQVVIERMKAGPVWLALDAAGVVGTASAVAKESSFYLRGMAVLPAARGLRIGERLLQEVEAFARNQGHCRLLLSTTPFLAAAIRLYTRCGFRRCEGTDDLFGTPLFTMEKALT
jgi:ribosomal protein S18 acetylase RimI-like enzyme